MDFIFYLKKQLISFNPAIFSTYPINSNIYKDYFIEINEDNRQEIKRLIREFDWHTDGAIAIIKNDKVLFMGPEFYDYFISLTNIFVRLYLKIKKEKIKTYENIFANMPIVFKSTISYSEKTVSMSINKYGADNNFQDFIITFQDFIRFMVSLHKTLNILKEMYGEDEYYNDQRDFIRQKVSEQLWW